MSSTSEHTKKPLSTTRLDDKKEKKLQENADLVKKQKRLASLILGSKNAKVEWAGTPPSGSKHTAPEKSGSRAGQLTRPTPKLRRKKPVDKKAVATEKSPNWLTLALRSKKRSGGEKTVDKGKGKEEEVASPVKESRKEGLAKKELNKSHEQGEYTQHKSRKTVRFADEVKKWEYQRYSTESGLSSSE